MAEKKITIGFSNDEYAEIQKLALAEGVSMTQFIKSQIIPNEFNNRYGELLRMIKKRKPGPPFSIKELWEPEEWDGISRGVKLALGRHFYRNVTVENISGIEAAGFGPAGVMLYKKT